MNTIPHVELKSIVEYICDPEKYETCKNFQERPDNTSTENIPQKWGYMGLILGLVA
jgi:hypothetical protein